MLNRRPREVADLIAFVASPRAGAITGTEYVIERWDGADSLMHRIGVDILQALIER
jgi:hypothetical protein